MIVVRVSRHVLYDDPLPGIGITKQEIGAERADTDLRPFEFKIDAEGFAQRFNIVGEPRREISGLVLQTSRIGAWMSR